MEENVINIVLTGGPCAGKTSCLELLKNFFMERGYSTYIVLESATELINSGINPKIMGMEVFQDIVLKYQLYKENLIKNSINNNDKTVIIYDRGVMDNKAYVGERIFKKLLTKYNLNEVDLLNRYDFVIHLETGAKSKFYTKSGNNARYESAQVAIKIDDEIINVWKNHYNFSSVKCCDDFKKKQREIIKLCNKFINEKNEVKKLRMVK